MGLENRDFLSQLEQWYWTQNHRRALARKAPAGWLLEVCEASRYDQESDEIAKGSRKNLALWGPSQSGKSTFLSYFIDRPESKDCALNFDPSSKVSFTGVHASDETIVLNPHNDMNDASGCVTRFSMQENVPEPSHSVRIGLAKSQDIMLALAIGYTVECKQVKVEGVDREIDPEVLSNKLPENDGGLLQENTQLFFDFITVLESLAFQGNNRFKKLLHRWEEGTKGRILGSGLGALPPEDMKSIIYDILWDGHTGITEVFEGMQKIRRELGDLIGDQPLHTNFAFARHLLNIQSLQDLEESEDSGSSGLTVDEIQKVRLEVNNGRAILAADVKGDPFFRGDALRFGLFQGLIWDLEVPLNAGIIRASGETITGFLSEYDVIDIPGAPNKSDAAEDSLLDFEVGVARSTVLARVLKRGKTLSIIDRFTTPGHVDHLLILARSTLLLPKAGYLAEEIRAIVHGRRETEEKDRPIVPLSICLTFMGVDINKRVNAPDMPFRNKRDVIQPLGSVADAKEAVLYLTTYPQFSEGKIDCTADQRDRIRGQIIEDPWFKERFLTSENEGTLDAMLNDADGGVGFVLTKLRERASVIDKSAALKARNAEFERKLSTLVNRIRPPEPNVDPHAERRGAIETLIEAISVSEGEKDPWVVCAKLRDLFTFRADDFARVPLSRHVDQKLANYLRTEIERWKARSLVDETFAEFGINGQKPHLIMDVASAAIDLQKTVDWLEGKQMIIQKKEEAEHMRHFLAVHLTNQVLDVERFNKRQVAAPDNVDLPSYSRSRIESWRDNEESSWAGPSYDMFIEPMIARLITLSEDARAEFEPDQPGDEEMRELLKKEPAVAAGGVK
jgi:hypothetical protein